MNLERILELFENLEVFLKKYGDNSILQSYKIVNRAIEVLKSKADIKEKEAYIIRSYKALFQSRGGLAEFYIWDNDFETRKALNEPFEYIHKELWDILKDNI